jgi:hypothetical protein
MLDPRFSSNPLVGEDGGIRFYAGAPVLGPGSDLPLGSVCVVDTVPRAGITPTEQHLLATLAEVASRRFSLDDVPSTRMDGDDRDLADERSDGAARAAPGRRSASS